MISSSCEIKIIFLSLSFFFHFFKEEEELPRTCPCIFFRIFSVNKGILRKMSRLILVKFLFENKRRAKIYNATVGDTYFFLLSPKCVYQTLKVNLRPDLLLFLSSVRKIDFNFNSVRFLFFLQFKSWGNLKARQRGQTFYVHWNEKIRIFLSK